MRLRSLSTFVATSLLALACAVSENESDDDGDDTAGSPAGGMSAGGAASGGAGSAGNLSAAGTAGSAGASATGGRAGAGNAGASIGGSERAGSGPFAGASGSGGSFSGGGGALSGAGGFGEGGAESGSAGVGSGGTGKGGMGAGGRNAGGAGGTATAGKGGAGGVGTGACPASGNVTYTLTRAPNPTADQEEAYELITAAMDKAIEYYNCYTNITKAENVQYNPSVQTADGNSNGSIRFGGKQYMEYSRAMHEIAHTVGVGTYQEFHDLVVDGIFTGEAATAQVREISGDSSEVVHADSQHFWPGGLNYASEAGSEQDVIDHCLMVVAIRKDMGFDP